MKSRLPALRFRRIEADLGLLVALPVGDDLVLHREQVADRDRAREPDPDVGLGLGRVRAVGPVGGIGVGDPVGVRRGLQRVAAVARPDHGRIDQLVDALGRHQQLAVLQGQVDLVAGHDVGDVHHEDVRPLLREQRGTLALLLGGLEELRRLFLLLDPGLDDPLADLHGQAMHGGAGRPGKDIAGVDRARARVAVTLGHGDPGDRALDDDVGRT